MAHRSHRLLRHARNLPRPLSRPRPHHRTPPRRPPPLPHLLRPHHPLRHAHRLNLLPRRRPPHRPLRRTAHPHPQRLPPRPRRPRHVTRHHPHTARHHPHPYPRSRPIRPLGRLHLHRRKMVPKTH